MAVILVALAVLVAALMLALGRITDPQAEVARAAGSPDHAPVVAAPESGSQDALPLQSACAFEPLLAANGAADGKFSLQAALANPQLPSSKSFLAVGREMAAAQRWRDAEIAMIAACRVATPSSGGRSVRVANAQMKLGELYAARASRRDATDPLFARAQQLLQASAAAYTEVLGKEASISRIAQERVASLDKPQRGPLFAGEDDASPRIPVDTGIMGAGPLASATVARDDADLGQLQGNIARLHAQARAITRDPAGMRQRDAAAQAQRDACKDESCLRRWYADRKRQLLNEFRG
jgi:hypothetical protein